MPARGTGSAGGNAREGRLLGMPPGIPSLASDKKKRAEPSLENSTGLRKQRRQHGGVPALESPAQGASPAAPHSGQANRKRTERRMAEAANSVWARALHAAPAQPEGMSLMEAHHFPDSGTVESNDPNTLHHFNRPGKAIPYKHPDPFTRIPKPSWVTNRWSPSSMYLGVLRKGKGQAAQNFPEAGGHNGMRDPQRARGCPSVCVPVVDGDKEKLCLTECRKERDEVEAFCASEFGRWCPPQPTGTEHLLSTCH